MKDSKPIFYKALIACVLIVGFGIYIALRGTKAKTEFESVTGKIDYFDTTFQEITYRNKGNHRFIHIEDYPIVFDVFVGKETGDFSPKFEQLDQLHIGDEITVYHDDKTPLQLHSDLRFNKTVQFIDKDNVAYFIRGNKDKYGGYALIGLGFMFVVALLILKRLGKIK
ncbi:hypothetical protein [Psychroserpens algicola]|uniref:DUF3592 domain-containing protein n=1 Tax=Psychroserpens algicola TaxID=1719034 RepID=A0ABT0H8E3_9FLAO|nr:hypothetical protein [Psychroserpens algicola]MCK8480632.1 hypothetical protein [Psychroserpens algicola]